MPWRVIALGDQVWHVDALAERPASADAWQLVLPFRAAAGAGLGGEAGGAGTVRSGLRQLKVGLESGLSLVVSAERDAHDRPRLEVDVVEAPQDAAAKQQIEVRFD